MSKRITVKRRIETIRNQINDTITNTVSNLILHTAEDAKTLVRTIIDLHLVRIDATAVAAVWAQSISVLAAGVAILNPATAQVLDAVRAVPTLWQNAGVTNIETVVGDMNGVHIFADIKGMRKMKANDTVQLAHIGTIASSYQLVGTIILFFKE